MQVPCQVSFVTDQPCLDTNAQHVSHKYIRQCKCLHQETLVGNLAGQGF